MIDERLIQEVKFKRKNEELTADVITVKVNEEERQLLEQVKKVIEQEKDSTALKQLAWIGAKVCTHPLMMIILETIYDNKRKNKRLGIVTFD